MTYQSVDGLRLIAVESGIFVALFILGFLGIRFVRPFVQPRWLVWVLSTQLRPVVLVIAIPIMLRALLLPFIGIPEPRVNDEFGHLLAADTFCHFRLTNPTPAFWEHFETFHVNMRPTYHSMYPVAQGLVLAFGQMLFHQPWVGVYLTTALLSGAICWALQAFVPPVWAFIGGLLAVARIAVLSYWMNSYWGGSVAALGGALALGAVVRLFDRERSCRHRTQLACVFAVALLILATSRPYEGLAFSIPLFGYFVYQMVRAGISGAHLRTILLPVVGIGALGMVTMGFYNHQTTGNALELPYVLNHRSYWPLPFFLWEKGNTDLALTDPVFVQFMRVTAEDYKLAKTKSASGLVEIETSRLLENWFFYVGPVLTLPLFIGLLSSYFRPRLRIAISVAVFTAAACALCLYNLLHYAAPATVVVYLLAAEGLRYVWEQREFGEQAFVIAVCATIVVTSLTKQTASSAMLYTFHLRDGRKIIMQQLQDKPGKHMVVVSYDLEHHHPANELVHNGADFDSERIVWARSKGRVNDLDLCQAYPDRTFWSVTTDDANFTLSFLDLCR